MQNKFYRSLKIIVVALGLCVCSQSFAVIPQMNNKPVITSLAPMLEKVMPAIVNIAVQGVLPEVEDPEKEDEPRKHRRQLNGRDKPRKFESLGSGVIMSAREGLIITNAHVVKDAQTITVTLSDGRRVKAVLVGADEESDVAVLRMKAKRLHTLPSGNSNEVKVGDFVVAIGNPFGLHQLGGTNQTATFGIVSALQRSALNIEGYENFIQTDAAINPGNSGGALINMEGQLVGINTAIISPYGGNIGIGFAIPINMARNVMQQLIKYGSVHRGMMGIYVQHLTPELAEAFSIPGAKGALVTQVSKGSPAEKAGLKAGDVVQEINGTPITDAAQVRNVIGLLRVGNKVSMQILRDGKKRRVHAKVADIKKHQEQAQSQNPFLFGLALRNFEQETPTHGLVKGVQVVGASENSAGWRAGLRPGDTIISINKQNVTNLEDLQKIANQSKTQLLVHVLRGPGSMYRVIK